MNLKEAFRFQNKLQSMMDEVDAILSLNSNITKVQNTYLRHKVMVEAEDETTIDTPPTEYGDKITELAEFMLHLLTERVSSIPWSPVTFICSIWFFQKSFAIITRAIGVM